MKPLLSVFILICCFKAQAEIVNGLGTCAGTKQIYNDSGDLVTYDPTIHHIDENSVILYSGTDFIPHYEVKKYRNTRIVVYNTSEREVRFFFEPTYYSSAGVSESFMPERFEQSFSDDNCPVANSGALLMPHTTGTIIVDAFDSLYPYNANATVRWESIICGKTPIVTVVEQVIDQKSNQGMGGITRFYVNGGKPF